MQNRGLENLKSSSGRSRRLLEQLGRVWIILKLSGAVLEASWGRLECVLRGQEVVFGASWVILDASEAIPGSLGASNGKQHEALHLSCRFLNDFEWISRPTIIEKSMKFGPKVIKIIVL